MSNAKKTRDLVIVGDSSFAEIACEYFERDSGYSVAGFAVERKFLRQDRLLGRDVVALEDLDARFPPKVHDVFVAVTYGALNHLRERLLEQAVQMGYRPASYVSSRAFVWENVELGEHCFVFEDNTVQPFVRLGKNVVLWSGNHIGHHSVIGDHCFIASHVVVSGHCEVGHHCFVGVNATLANNVRLGDHCWVGPGVLLTGDAAPDGVYAVAGTERRRVSAKRWAKVAP